MWCAAVGGRYGIYLTFVVELVETSRWRVVAVPFGQPCTSSPLAISHSRCIAQVSLGHVIGEDAIALMAMDAWGFELWSKHSENAKN